MQLTSSRPVHVPGPEDVVVPGQEDVPVLERELRSFFRRLRQWQRGADRVGLELDEHTFGVLSTVHDRGPSRLQDLAADLGLDASTVSRHVTALERCGLLTRVPDPDDRRARRVILTADGSAAWSRDREARRELVRRALSRWPADDRRRLTSLLTQLNAELATLLTEPEKEPA
ncbi:MarR family winged helix-turn-helix transcriptional regulator [Auraticoccus monumenti]|uniref:DNA-binding transcriptional regulator, MarR family n=1 Tax=Auraticoccus monumenti TaxID=675864 RepID=A0A1G7ECW5_9ACTN|nr:MarR family winged helix-turn-helix transcriptional regulator [Auraticoccus monumenti]SDE61306.1 DNA-binding transcriptional regulator, MarR family [Auraticoccus monumenti]